MAPQQSDPWGDHAHSLHRRRAHRRSTPHAHRLRRHQDTGASKPDAAAESSSPRQQEPEPTKDDSEGSADETETGTLPDFTGQGLQEAQDGAQAAGFYVLTSSDATGADRMQIFDRSWKVCSQTPAAGEHPTSTTVNFDTVKLGENC